MRTSESHMKVFRRHAPSEVGIPIGEVQAGAPGRKDVHEEPGVTSWGGLSAVTPREDPSGVHCEGLPPRACTPQELNFS